MEVLKQRIRKEGVVRSGNVLKVDTFLNHQMDIDLLNEIGKEFKRRFDGVKVDKILTIETSGIGIAAITAQYFHCPVVCAKKSHSINLEGIMLSTEVESSLTGGSYHVIVANKLLIPGENILIIDDILGNGCAVRGLAKLIKAAYANVTGAGIVIEKGFQSGGEKLRKDGIRVESLAVIESMDPEIQRIEFR